MVARETPYHGASPIVPDPDRPLVPQRIEFWNNMPNRLHERLLYTRSGDGWRIEVLYP